MTERAYLDWNASAPLRPEAHAAVMQALDRLGNPSSIHAEGRAARHLIERARAQVASLVDVDPANVIFTSGATEANVLALSPGWSRKPGEAPDETVHGVRYLRLPIQRRRGGTLRYLFEYAAFFTLAFAVSCALALRRRYDVFQAHNFPDFLVFCGLPHRLRGTKVVLDLHDLMPEFYTSRFGSQHGWLARLVGLQERWSCRFAHHVITVTQPWRAALIERGVPPAKCTVVMNVADDRIFRPRPRPNGGRLDVHCLYHGNLTWRNGLDLVLQAVD